MDETESYGVGTDTEGTPFFSNGFGKTDDG